MNFIQIFTLNLLCPLDKKKTILRQALKCIEQHITSHITTPHNHVRTDKCLYVFSMMLYKCNLLNFTVHFTAFFSFFIIFSFTSVGNTILSSFFPSLLPSLLSYLLSSPPSLFLFFNLYSLLPTLYLPALLFFPSSSPLFFFLSSPPGPCLYLFFLPSLPSLTHYTLLYFYLSLLITFFLFCWLIPFNSSSSQIMLLILQIQY